MKLQRLRLRLLHFDWCNDLKIVRRSAAVGPRRCDLLANIIGCFFYVSRFPWLAKRYTTAITTVSIALQPFPSPPPLQDSTTHNSLKNFLVVGCCWRYLFLFFAAVAVYDDGQSGSSSSNSSSNSQSEAENWLNATSRRFFSSLKKKVKRKGLSLSLSTLQTRVQTAATGDAMEEERLCRNVPDLSLSRWLPSYTFLLSLSLSACLQQQQLSSVSYTRTKWKHVYLHHSTGRRSIWSPSPPLLTPLFKNVLQSWMERKERKTKRTFLVTRNQRRLFSYTKWGGKS